MTLDTCYFQVLSLRTFVISYRHFSSPLTSISSFCTISGQTLVRNAEGKLEKMASTNQTPTKKTPQKANLLDHRSIKNLLDESVTEIVKSKGYPENVRLSNVRLLIGTIIIAIALVAQFYKKEFPANRDFLIGCIVLYILFNVILQLIIQTKEKNAILFTYPPEGSFNSTGLIVSSKLPRFSDMYTLTVESADPKSISSRPKVEFTKSVTKWFAKDGVLVEGLFWKDVESLVNDYAKEHKKSK